MNKDASSRSEGAWVSGKGKHGRGARAAQARTREVTRGEGRGGAAQASLKYT